MMVYESCREPLFTVRGHDLSCTHFSIVVFFLVFGRPLEEFKANVPNDSQHFSLSLDHTDFKPAERY